MTDVVVPDAVTYVNSWTSDVGVERGGLLIGSPVPTSAKRHRRYAAGTPESRLAKRTWKLLDEKTGQVTEVTSCAMLLSYLFPTAELHRSRRLARRLAALLVISDRPDAVRVELQPLTDPETGAAVSTRVTVSVVDATLAAVGADTPEAYTALSKVLQRVLDFAPDSAALLPPSNQTGAALDFAPEERFALTLWPAQRKNVHWICEMENDPEQQEHPLHNPNHLQIGQSALALKRGELCLLKGCDAAQLSRRSTLSCHGGIVCDPTGLGKSITMIAAIYKQKLLGVKPSRYSELPLVRANPCRADYWFSRATLIVCPKYLVKQWSDYMRDCFGAILVSSTGPRARRSAGGEEREPFRVSEIRNAGDLKKLDLYYLTEEAVVIVVPKDLFKSDVYRTRWRDADAPARFAAQEKTIREAGHEPATERREILDAKRNYTYRTEYTSGSMDRMRRTTRVAKQDGPGKEDMREMHEVPLESIWWSRVVLDEIHELEADWAKVNRCISQLQADTYWGLTATPKFDETSSASYRKLLHVESNEKLEECTPALACFVQHFTRRSGRLEIPVTHYRVEVRMSAQELALYHSRNQEHIAQLVQFCSHHSLDDDGAEGGAPRSVDEVCRAIQADRQASIAGLKESIEAVGAEQRVALADLRVALAKDASLVCMFNAGLADDLPELAKRIRALTTNDWAPPPAIAEALAKTRAGVKLQRKEARLASRLDSVQREFDYYQRTFDLLARADEAVQCVVCYDEIPPQATALLPCGHIYDRPCLLKFWEAKSRRTCPQCRYQLADAGELRMIDRTACEREPEVNQAEAVDHSLYGSKIKRLIELIQSVLHDGEDRGKVLVYAQWDHLLHKISAALTEFGVRNVVVEGSIHQMNANFAAFKEDPAVPVMMLSMESNLSGSNLPEASDLIFVHPAAGVNQETAYAGQQQAIGRLLRIGQRRHVRVHHMVTANTVEEELYSEQSEYARKQPDFRNDPDLS